MLMVRPTRNLAILQAPPPVSVPAGRKPTLMSVGLGIAVAGLVLASPPTDRLAPLLGAAIYLLLAIEYDVRSLRIPNWLNAAGILGAFLMAAWLGGLPGFAAALAGAGTALAVGFTLFALGIIGAGDAKGLPVLGALFGASALPGLLWWMAILAGALGIALIIARGEGLEFLRRWSLMARGFLTTRTLVYLAPARESAAASGLPFAIPMGLGTAAHQLWGTPWIG